MLSPVAPDVSGHFGVFRVWALALRPLRRLGLFLKVLVRCFCVVFRKLRFSHILLPTSAPWSGPRWAVPGVVVDVGVVVVVDVGVGVRVWGWVWGWGWG